MCRVVSRTVCATYAVNSLLQGRARFSTTHDRWCESCAEDSRVNPIILLNNERLMSKCRHSLLNHPSIVALHLNLPYVWGLIVHTGRLGQLVLECSGGVFARTPQQTGPLRFHHHSGQSCRCVTDKKLLSLATRPRVNSDSGLVGFPPTPGYAVMDF